MSAATSRRATAIAAIAAGVVVATAVQAVDEMTLEIASAEGAGWRADNIAVTVALAQPKAAGRVVVAQLQAKALPQPLRNIRIDCSHLELSDRVLACRQARVHAPWPGLGRQALQGEFVYARNNGALELTLRGIRLGQGRADLQASLGDSGWNVRAHLQSVPVELAAKLARELRLPLPALAATGLANLTLSAHGKGSELVDAEINGALSELTANNDSGSLASDKLSLQLQASVRRSKREWLFSARMQAAQGQAFAQPIFLDLSAHPLSVSARGRLRERGSMTVERFTVQHTGVAQGNGRAELQLNGEQPLRDLQLQLSALQFPAAYDSYLQPLLLETDFKSLQTSGRIAGAIGIQGGELRHIDLSFEDVTVNDGAQKLALAGLRGEWHWQAQADADVQEERRAPVPAGAQSRLQWGSGALFGLDLGPSELRFTTQGRQFRLLEPTRIPVLDGAIELSSLRVRNAGTPAVAFIVDAAIQPISMPRLCRAFGWPEFGGSVGGVISKLRMREGVLTLGTTLRAQVFDGDVTVSDLRLDQPFGQWIRFYSNIALNNLDLDLITSAFSFGRITGRLSGAIDGLELFNWAPVAFEARLYTPAGDRSRHRISQRAVENIGSLGGGGAGVAAALSSGFLRFFDDFNYDRLGLSCRLQNQVCLMDGVAPAPNGGYYLVKGQGVPRIDVIGSSRRVDWTRLVQQLIAATRSQGPVVE